MVKMSLFVEVLVIGIGLASLTLGASVAAGELEDRLFEACEEPYNYELASWVLSEGADTEALSPDGETVLQRLLRQRYESSPYVRHNTNTIMVTLLLKHGARLPDSPAPGKNPVVWMANRLDQVTWDVLAVKFGEAGMVRYAGWPTRPIATVASGDNTIALPPPPGFAPAPEGVEKLLALLAKTVLDPDTAMFFVPTEQADLPLSDITAAAAFVDRRDLVGMTDEKELHKALSLTDETTGGSYTEYFSNASYHTVFPTGPVPWNADAAESREGEEKRMISSHGALGRERPYQLVHYRTDAPDGTRDNAGKSSFHAYGMLAAWHFALREANP